MLRFPDVLRRPQLSLLITALCLAVSACAPAPAPMEPPATAGSAQTPRGEAGAPLFGEWPQYAANPHVIRIDAAPRAEEARPGGSGGLIVHDVTGDGFLDYLVTAPGQIAAYDHDGHRLWRVTTDIHLTSQSEAEGLPGFHAPGLQAGDPDGDGRAEVLFLSRGGDLRVLDGPTGRPEKTHPFPPPFRGVERWEHLVLANLRGEGDRDLVLQATNPHGYRMGRYVAAYGYDRLLRGAFWRTDDYAGCAHNGLRVADLDGDGRDEILGATLLRPDGTPVAWTRPAFGVTPDRWKKLYDNTSWSWLRFPDYHGHLDSIYARDVRPERPGLEVVALQEGGAQRVFLYGLDGFLWEAHHEHQEPQNAAIGDFDPSRPGLEIWSRSRHDRHQTPFVFDAHGRLIAAWEMSRVAPPDWTDKGIEVIHTIDWDGGERQYLAAKERHESGDVAILDALTGRFVERFPTRARRLLVADVSGDWREELIVLTEDDELQIWFNEAENRNPDREGRLWDDPAYRRGKMTWNYYSP